MLIVHRNNGGESDFSTSQNLAAINFRLEKRSKQKMKRTINHRTEIMIETHEVCIVRSISRDPASHCPYCGSERLISRTPNEIEAEIYRHDSEGNQNED